jgi:hypothetical protein
VRKFNEHCFVQCGIMHTRKMRNEHLRNEQTLSGDNHFSECATYVGWSKCEMQMFRTFVVQRGNTE